MLSRRQFIKSMGLTVLAGGIGLSHGFAAEIPVRKVAILPVGGAYADEKDLVRIIDQAMREKFRTPLQDFVPRYQLVPELEVRAALPPGIRPEKLAAPQLAVLAKTLGADWLIGTEILEFQHYTFMTFDGELMQKTEVALRLSSYEAAAKELRRWRDWDSYFGDYSIHQDPQTMTRQLIDRLLDKLPAALLAR